MFLGETRHPELWQAEMRVARLKSLGVEAGIVAMEGGGFRVEVERDPS
jgi:hypothetical protein